MLKPGFVLENKYRIISVLGQGGMSTVYLAVHQRLNQKWAVKEISREYCENYEMISRQLLMEADILKKLNHPGLPKIIDIIEKKNVIWMVMEFVEGKTLKEIVQQEGRIKEKIVLGWGKQLCDVLSYLHSRKPPIIYRDLKPENIILQKTGRLVVIDFGTAREYSYQENICDEVYLGTKGYAAPEQYGYMGQTDERTDIYCLGVTLYTLLTGFNPEEPPYKVYSAKYWGRHISPGIKDVILTCIQSKPEKRYQSCKELSYALSYLEHEFQKDMEKKKKEQRKFYGIILLIMFLIITFLGYRNAIQIYKRKVVRSYISAAEKSVDKREAEKYYKKALLELPDEKDIYSSLIKYFISPNNFQIEDAAILTGLATTFYENEPVLDILRKNSPREYREFCYAVGIGYFYDMGGVAGKAASEKWFCEASNVSEMAGKGERDKQLENDKRKRASAYADIADYYNTFLVNGIDESGERETKDFFDFYKSLHSLNQVKITKDSTKSDISAMYLISKEVAVEITNYAEEFLADRRINKKMLENELEKIRERKTYFEREEKQKIELSQFLDDAEKRLKMIAENIRK